MPALPSRLLTATERALVASVFGDAVDADRVMIHRRRWWLFQPRHICMAPRGSLHFHPECRAYRDCFASGDWATRGFFIHEMAHVWQHQAGINLLIRRHPFCRYTYRLRPGWALRDYDVEQQAEIIRHAYLLRHGVDVPGAPERAALEALLPFTPQPFTSKP